MLVIGVGVPCFWSQAATLESVPSGKRFEAQGFMQSTYYPEKGGALHLSNRFRVLVMGCNSMIQATGVDDESIEYFQYGTYDNGSYSLVKFVQSRLSPKSLNWATLFIYPSPVPVSTSGFIPQIWAAYASMCFYNTNGTGQLEPISFLAYGFRQRDLKLEAAWKVSTNYPNVLESLIEFSDGKKYIDLEPERLRIESLPRPLKGKPITTYNVRTWTNNGKLILPATFEVTHYRPDIKKGEFVLQQKLEGVTTFVSDNVEEAALTLAVPTNTLVYDHRFYWNGARLSPIAYMSATGNLKSKEGVRQLKDYHAELERAKMDRPKISAGSKVFFGIFLVITLIPLLLFVLAKLQKPKVKG